MEINSLVEQLGKLDTRSMFMTIEEYRNSADEIADYSIAFHVSYQSLLKRSLIQLETYIPENETELQAKQELMKSYQSSLDKMKEKSQEELEEHYTHFKDCNGNYIKGVKLHNDSNTLHLYGVIVHKRVTQPGNYKKVNSSQLTLAKQKISNELPISRWRQFKIVPGQAKSINVQKMQITVE